MEESLDLLISEFVRRLAEMPCKPPHPVQIAALCPGAQIPELQVPLHLIPQLSHGHSPFHKRWLLIPCCGKEIQLRPSRQETNSLHAGRTQTLFSCQRTCGASATAKRFSSTSNCVVSVQLPRRGKKVGPAPNGITNPVGVSSCPDFPHRFVLRYIKLSLLTSVFSYPNLLT